MKGKILGIILSITLCSSIFGVRFINNTDYELQVAVSKKGNSPKDYIYRVINPRNTDNINPVKYQDNYALIRFVRFVENLDVGHAIRIPFPQGQVQITENTNNFIINEHAQPLITIPKTKAFRNSTSKILDTSDDEETDEDLDKDNKDKVDEKDKSKSKTGLFTLNKMIIFGSVAAIAGYLIWNNYNKTQKTNIAK